MLLPAIAGLDDPAMVIKFPLDMTHCFQLQKSSNGHSNLRGTFCSSSNLDAIVLNMASIIDQSPGTLLDPFKDFFFVSHAHGIKVRVEGIEEVEKKLPEINQSFFSSATAIYVDYAMEMFSQSMFGKPGTALFQISSGNGSFGHSSLVQDFFQNHYSEKKMGGKFRRDQFLNFDNLGGFDFKSDIQSPEGAVAIKGYTTFKTPFYHRVTGGNRHTKGLSASDLMNPTSSKAVNYFVSVFFVSFKSFFFF